MRTLAIAAITTSFAVPAFAQGDASKAEANKAEERKKKEAEEIEKTYKDTLKKTTHEQPAKKQTHGEVYAKPLEGRLSCGLVFVALFRKDFFVEFKVAHGLLNFLSRRQAIAINHPKKSSQVFA